MRLNEDGEPINLENMPRPHRRRREKKLMTMDEVNEKFPMVKYKNWVASRIQEGLPARGGVSAPASRANSIRSVEGIIPELPSKERESTEDRPVTSTTSKEKRDEPQEESKDGTSATADDKAKAATDGQTSTAPATAPPAVPRASDEHTDDDEDDEHINAALPPECLGTSGDTCAICIDTIEDDDDVRGLTCGHAFHAVCLDPWLTSRRACCPLCKADYYTPKPRPAAPEVEGPQVIAIVTSEGRHRGNMPSRPGNTWVSMRQGGRMFPVRFVIRGGDHVSDQPTNAQAAAQHGSPGRLRLFNRTRQRSSSSNQATAGSQTSETAPTAGNNWFSSFRSGFPSFRANPLRRNDNQQLASTEAPMVSGANPAPSTVTPSQLEAGTRSTQ
jgi:hypothetical protein